MVGAFAGSAIAMPLVQIGTLISVTGFILVQQPWLGLIVLAVVLPQALIVKALQARINARVRERVQLLRDASDRISESDMQAIDAAVQEDFQKVYETRKKIFVLKLTSKLALQVISALGRLRHPAPGRSSGARRADRCRHGGRQPHRPRPPRRPLARADRVLQERQHGAGEVRDAGQVAGAAGGAGW